MSFVSLVAVLSAACAAGSSRLPAPRPAWPDSATCPPTHSGARWRPLPPGAKLLASPVSATGDAGFRAVVRDSGTWRALWRELRGQDDASSPPPVDFTRDMLLVAAAGARSTTGHGISVDSLRRQGRTLEALVINWEPSSGGGGMMVTHPVFVALVPRFGGRVRFRECSLRYPDG